MSFTALLLALTFVLTIVNRLYSKKTLNALDSYATSLLSNVISGVIALPFFLSYARPISEFSFRSLCLIILLGFLWSIAAWAINASIALNDFSFKEIIRQTRVLWVVLGGVLLLGETLSPGDWAGITCIVGSVFLISYKKVSFKQHLTSRAMLLAWFSSILIAVITLLEKYVLNEVEVIEYVFLNYVLTSLFLMVWLNRSRVEKIKETVRSFPTELLIFSVLMCVAYAAGIATYKYLPISVAYPIIQSASVFAILIGTRVFENNEHMLRKSFAACAAVVGVVVIQLF